MADISDSEIDNASIKSNESDSDYYSDSDIEDEADITLEEKNIEDTTQTSISNALPDIDINQSNTLIVDTSSDEEDEENILDIKTTISSMKKKNQMKNNTEIKMLCKVKRNKEGKIVDKFHTTLPILSKYEKTRIIGQRAKQIENGSAPFIEIKNNIIDTLLIAEEELRQKKIPIIIKRPLPNGTNEYWPLKDLQLI